MTDKDRPRREPGSAGSWLFSGACGPSAIEQALISSFDEAEVTLSGVGVIHQLLRAFSSEGHKTCRGTIC